MDWAADVVFKSTARFNYYYIRHVYKHLLTPSPSSLFGLLTNSFPVHKTGYCRSNTTPMDREKAFSINRL